MSRLLLSEPPISFDGCLLPEPPTVQEKLEAIRHRKLDLSNPDVFDKPTDNDPHRPEIRLWAGLDENGGQAHVTLALMSLWGQGSRYADLHPDEARKLARVLLEMADTVDHVVARAS